MFLWVYLLFTFIFQRSQSISITADEDFLHLIPLSYLTRSGRMSLPPVHIANDSKA